MLSKVALITGVTGQDGAYLARFLLSKGYEVHGLRRRSSSFNSGRIEDIRLAPQDEGAGLRLHYGDMTDSSSLLRLLSIIRPSEIYNLAAQSHVQVSFEVPEYTANSDAFGVLRILEAMRSLDMVDGCRYYQASTSELYGMVREIPQTENTPFYPRSPYAVAKLYAYWITKNYREAYDLFGSNGILFNHESPLRGETFVTQKIIRGLVDVKRHPQKVLYLGNLDAKRDWGHARDYVEAQWLMLQHSEPDDFVIATGEQYSVREFAEAAAARLGITLEWSGSGLTEQGINAATGQCIIKVDPLYFRPAEVSTLLGDASKAKHLLGWKPSITFDQMIDEMVDVALGGDLKFV